MPPPSEVLVQCGSLQGKLLVYSAVIVTADGREYSFNDFERLGGMETARKWRKSIKLVENNQEMGLGDWLDRNAIKYVPGTIMFVNGVSVRNQAALQPPPNSITAPGAPLARHDGRPASRPSMYKCEGSSADDVRQHMAKKIAEQLMACIEQAEQETQAGGSGVNWQALKVKALTACYKATLPSALPPLAPNTQQQPPSLIGLRPQPLPAGLATAQLPLPGVAPLMPPVKRRRLAGMPQTCHELIAAERAKQEAQAVKLAGEAAVAAGWPRAASIAAQHIGFMHGRISSLTISSDGSAATATTYYPLPGIQPTARAPAQVSAESLNSPDVPPSPQAAETLLLLAGWSDEEGKMMRGNRQREMQAA